MKATYEGDVETYYGYGAVRWFVYKVWRSKSGEETRLPVLLAHGDAKNMHGAKSMIAKKCREFERKKPAPDAP